MKFEALKPRSQAATNSQKFPMSDNIQFHFELLMENNEMLTRMRWQAISGGGLLKWLLLDSISSPSKFIRQPFTCWGKLKFEASELRSCEASQLQNVI
jgi:hypothetical protein